MKNPHCKFVEFIKFKLALNINQYYNILEKPVKGI